VPSGKSAEEKRLRAQLHFEKGEQRRVEAAKAVDDHLARSRAEAAKTARLRALRLAKEAADDLNAKKIRADKQAVLSAAQDAPRKKTAKRKKSTTDVP
jgi:hypothetical protein